jgi:hypothetical protein
MQNRDSLHKIRHILTFTVLSLMALIGAYYLTNAYFPSVSNEILPRVPDKITAKIMSPYWADLDRFNTVDPAKDKIMLSKHDETIIEDIKIIYRGTENRSQFNMDVIVLNFDHEMPFAHTIKVSQAKKGFRLAGKNFQLISARKHRIQLWHLKKRQY